MSGLVSTGSVFKRPPVTPRLFIHLPSRTHSEWNICTIHYNIYLFNYPQRLRFYRLSETWLNFIWLQRATLGGGIQLYLLKPEERGLHVCSVLQRQWLSARHSDPQVHTGAHRCTQVLTWWKAHSWGTNNDFMPPVEHPIPHIMPCLDSFRFKYTTTGKVYYWI